MMVAILETSYQIHPGLGKMLSLLFHPSRIGISTPHRFVSARFLEMDNRRQMLHSDS